MNGKNDYTVTVICNNPALLKPGEAAEKEFMCEGCFVLLANVVGEAGVCVGVSRGVLYADALAEAILGLGDEAVYEILRALDEMTEAVDKRPAATH